MWLSIIRSDYQRTTNVLKWCSSIWNFSSHNQPITLHASTFNSSQILPVLVQSSNFSPFSPPFFAPQKYPQAPPTTTIHFWLGIICIQVLIIIPLSYHHFPSIPFKSHHSPTLLPLLPYFPQRLVFHPPNQGEDLETHEIFDRNAKNAVSAADKLGAGNPAPAPAKGFGSETSASTLKAAEEASAGTSEATPEPWVFDGKLVDFMVI